LPKRSVRPPVPKSHKPSTPKPRAHTFRLHPRNDSQQDYVETIQANHVTFGLGPAGTGKTFLAVALAVEALKAGTVDKIILVRPAVEAGESLGYLPGGLEEKIDPYLRPIWDALDEIIGSAEAKTMHENGLLELAPIAFMRGRTLKRAFVIMDEAQNITKLQMKMLLTRLGKGFKAVVNGDMQQVDLPKHVGSGLEDAVKRLEKIGGIGVFRFSQEDVVRHPLVQQIVAAYED
jgi:phosphate starvation-inducible protein PhoH and related proteins